MTTTTEITKFNIRVYGLLFNEHNQLLVSDEVIKGQHITKFPGGGLEFNESTLECLTREFQEEMEQAIEIESHFYTTDQFIRSAFRPWEQVMCVYYRVKLIGEAKFQTQSERFNFNPNIEGDQEVFRWCALNELEASDFTFLSDSHVIELLKSQA